MPDKETFGISVMTNVIWVVNLKLLIIHQNIDIFSFVGYSVFAGVLHIMWLWVMDTSTLVEHSFTFDEIFSSPIAYLTNVLGIGICFMIDLALRDIGNVLYRDTRDIVREHALTQG